MNRWEKIFSVKVWITCNSLNAYKNKKTPFQGLSAVRFGKYFKNLIPLKIAFQEKFCGILINVLLRSTNLYTDNEVSKNAAFTNIFFTCTDIKRNSLTNSIGSASFLQ